MTQDFAESNLPALSVSELAGALKKNVEEAFGRVRVRGEVSQPKLYASGHLYLRLKDADAVLEAVCWRGTMSKLRVKPEEGLEMICTGRLTTYPGRSQYQLIIEQCEAAGLGALMQLLAARKAKLAAEGLFASERKQALPYLPEVIGIITSQQGAVIRDIIHRLQDRFPRRILLWPVAVQGDGAAEQIVAALRGFNTLPPLSAGAAGVPRPDLIIIARGGGSFEDLLPFSDEAVVRMAAASSIPVISAIGHETDHSLLDLAADCRAPTPTAAAEMAVPVRRELWQQLQQKTARAHTALQRQLQEQGATLRGLARGLLHPTRQLENLAQKLDERAQRLTATLTRQLKTAAQALHNMQARLTVQLIENRLQQSQDKLRGLQERLRSTMPRLLQQQAQRLENAARLLAAGSIEQTLARGFVLLLDANGLPIRLSAQVEDGSEATLRFQDAERAIKFIR